jgi:hypothetical protein
LRGCTGTWLALAHREPMSARHSFHPRVQL